jgi:hypothetical protein
MRTAAAVACPPTRRVGDRDPPLDVVGTEQARLRRSSQDEVRALLEDHVVVDVVEERNRYVLLGRVHGRTLIAVVVDDGTR